MTPSVQQEKKLTEKPQWIKVQPTTAEAICKRFSLPPMAEKRLRTGMTPRDFVDALLEGKQYLAAVDFIAHALPQREAIWWGCLCLQHASGGRLSTVERTACKAAVQWILSASPETRAAAKAPGEAGGQNSPGGLLAMAVSQTLPVVAGHLPSPATPAVASMVATSIKMVSMRGEAAVIAGNLRTVIELGGNIAEGRFLR